MICTILILEIRFAGCGSLKDKRSILKPILHKLHMEFNISASEIDKNDVWNESVIGCALISNEKNFAESCLAKIPDFLTNHFSHIDILKYSIQFI